MMIRVISPDHSNRRLEKVVHNVVDKVIPFIPIDRSVKVFINSEREVVVACDDINLAEDIALKIVGGIPDGSETVVRCERLNA